MIIVTVLGLKKSGKTTSCEALIRQFKLRGLKVGAVKSMHHARMTIDTEGKDTWRHRQAGADFVVSLSKGEMGYIEAASGRTTLNDAKRHFPPDTDVLVCEGVEGLGSEAYSVVALKSVDMLAETLKIRGLGGGKNILALTGIFSNDAKANPNYPVFNCTVKKEAKALADLIIKNGGRR